MTRRILGQPDARSLALEAMLAFDEQGAFLVPTVDAACARMGISGPDRGLAVELACGAVRRERTLDAVLSAFSNRGLGHIAPEVRAILHLGIYQMLFLDRIPAHAAVHATVELCHRVDQQQAAGFVNGILRNLARTRPDERVSLSGLADCDAATVPLCHITAAGTDYTGWRFAKALFDDPEESPETYVVQALSLPDWLVERWLKRMTDDEIFQTGAWFSTTGRTCLRVNLLKATREQCLESLQAAGIDVAPGDLPESIRVLGGISVDQLPQLRSGMLSVQDESAQSAVDLLDPQPGETLLDLCSAPGGKTTFMAERMHDRGRVVACETEPDRLQRVRENINRLGLACIDCRTIQPSGSDIPVGPFDGVLVDVPCSNTGVLGKRPEARWRTMLRSLDELIPLQRRLLRDALARTRPGGRVVYSTCSIEPAENRQVVDQLLTEFPGVQLATERHFKPGAPVDGAYQALLRKPL